ncbi:hypothetical protein FRC01_008568 [Tulasnella sp. 417]|nr:hypothetical protein FRC01_008568 [Tulasnella sp. 417]
MVPGSSHAGKYYRMKDIEDIGAEWADIQKGGNEAYIQEFKDRKKRETEYIMTHGTVCKTWDLDRTIFWAASSGEADEKGKYKSLAFRLVWEADICVLVVRFAGLVQSPARGGSGGNPFSDESFVNPAQPASITAVKINYKTGIDRIHVRYGDEWAEPHGGSAGLQGLSEETFFLQRGETIVQVEGRSGTKLDSLQFTTSTGRKTQVYGGTGGYTFSWSGKKLAYISGRSGDQVDNLQSYWVA